jgi:SPOR domain
MSYNLGRIDPDQRTGLYADPRDDEVAPPPRRVLRIVAVLLVMTLFAGGLWFAYVEGARHAGRTANTGDIPLIRADTRPMKVKPATPGGMQIPDRDMLIYGQNRPVVEHLLPPPEQPMARPSPPPPAQAEASRPQAAAPPALSSETAPAPAAPNTAAAPAAPTPAVSARPEQAAAVPPVNPHPAAPKTAPAEAAPAKTGGVRLQLGAVRSEGVARAEWDRIKRNNSDLLGNVSAVPVRADLGDKGVYYRIQTAPLADTSRADRICAELKQRHLGCIIVR